MQPVRRSQRPMTRRFLAPLALLLLAAPAAAQQQSQSYKFLEAVRKADGSAVTSMLDQPGQTVINARDVTTGEGALHIVVKRGDATYARFLLARGADANLRDGRGETPLLLAIQFGQGELVDILIQSKANVNLPGSGGETPLIRAVQRRDLELVRTLLAAGANPDQTDNVAGMSARDYAAADARAVAIAKLLAETPKKTPRAVAGPRL
jgi:hypothetical protein